MSEVGANWGQTAKDLAVSALSIFLHGACFALGGLAVARLASINTFDSAGDVVIPFRKTGT